MPTRHFFARCLFVFFTAFCAVAANAAEPIATVSLQAKLFNAKSGTFSTDILAAGAAELFNVVARDDPSSASFVIVSVALADSKLVPSDSRVRLVAREPVARSATSGKSAPARTLLDQTAKLGAISKGGVTHLGFWLPDTGCRPVQLKATLTVARQPIIISADSVIPFVCGE